MTTEQLREFHQARPFKPFRVHMADGQSIDVLHPELMAYGGGRTFVVFVSQEHSRVIDLLLVASLETINGKPQGKGRRSNKREK
jgi:hypothetical protein